jgi:cellulose synthase/poly-beta-1,6-N-acetylglucosamine synthase-like glycosyltransferase
MKVPFTAARARNAGYSRLRELQPDLQYVQFIDGDCMLLGGWLDAAVQFLDEEPAFAVVCGRRRERYPERSVYNWLCDIEWNTHPGEAEVCGGDALCRVTALEQVNGYRDDLIAGEEPDLCARLRLRGWKIWRLDRDMTLHDAAMTRFGQWWRRNVRGGHAFAEGAALHGGPPLRLWVRESRSAWLWGCVLPLAIVVSTVIFGPWALCGLLAYPLQVSRLALGSSLSSASELPAPDNFRYAAFLVLAKFPEACGQLLYWRNRLYQRRSTLIEYK